jgi:hypothetical protein
MLDTREDRARTVDVGLVTFSAERIEQFDTRDGVT